MWDGLARECAYVLYISYYVSVLIIHLSIHLSIFMLALHRLESCGGYLVVYPMDERHAHNKRGTFTLPQTYSEIPTHSFLEHRLVRNAIDEPRPCKEAQISA
jgi:hypothetical protein